MMMEVEKKSRVAFQSTLDRQVFPTHVPHTRFGNNMTAIRGAPNRGPGCYENEDATNFWHEVDSKITSNKGYSLGARTASKIKKDWSFLTPAPCTYQTGCTEPQTFTPCAKPFHAAADRFPEYRRNFDEITPGPGTYGHELKMNRKVQWQGSFGSAPLNLPDIKQHSTIESNTEKLLSTKDEKKQHRVLAYLKLYYD